MAKNRCEWFLCLWRKVQIKIIHELNSDENIKSKTKTMQEMKADQIFQHNLTYWGKIGCNCEGFVIKQSKKYTISHCSTQYFYDMWEGRIGVNVNVSVFLTSKIGEFYLKYLAKEISLSKVFSQVSIDASLFPFHYMCTNFSVSSFVPIWRNVPRSSGTHSKLTFALWHSRDVLRKFWQYFIKCISISFFSNIDSPDIDKYTEGKMKY